MMENDRPLAEILLATYNGEKYIGELLDSLIDQTYENILITVSDDCSTDTTMEIIGRYQDNHPGLFRIIPHNERFGNAKDNFFFLLRNAVADHVFLCDQDDVWLPEKVEVMMKELVKHEDVPALIHCDLRVVDASLNTVSDSFVRYSNYDPEHEDFHSLVFMNTVTGCASAVNRELISKLNLTSISEYGNIIMHDGWLALIAASLGSIKYINLPLILYRQHSDNSVGAVHYNFLRLKGMRKKASIITRKKVQSDLFLRLYGDFLGHEEREFLKAFIKRRSGVLFYVKYLKNLYGLKRKLGFLLYG